MDLCRQLMMREGIGVREGLHPWSMVLFPSEQETRSSMCFLLAFCSIRNSKLAAGAQLTLAVQIYVREILKRQGLAIWKRQGLAIESWRGKLARYLK
jgi:hypothetical protein